MALPNLDSTSQNIDPPLPPLEEPIGSRNKAHSVWPLIFAFGLTFGLVAKALDLGGYPRLGHLISAFQLEHARGILALLLAIVAGLILHETAHIVAAILLSFEVQTIALGFIILQRHGKRWRLQFRKAWIAGSVQVIPKHDFRLRRRFLFFLVVGPLSNLCFALASTWAYLALASNSTAQIFFANAAVFGCVSTVFSLIPHSAKPGAWNDTGFFLALLQKKPTALSKLATIEIFFFSKRGVRLKDFPATLIQSAALSTPNATTAVLHASVVANWCLDRADLQSAGAWWDRAAVVAPMSSLQLRNVVLASSACFDVAWKEDLTTAPQKLADIEPSSLTQEVYRHRTQALFYILERAWTDAMSELNLAEAQVPKTPFGDFERDTLNQLRRVVGRRSSGLN